MFFWSVSHLHLGVVELSYAAIGATMYNNILWDLFEVLEQLTRVVWVWKKIQKQISGIEYKITVYSPLKNQ